MNSESMSAVETCALDSSCPKCVSSNCHVLRDKLLVERIQNGTLEESKEAVGELLERYFARIKRYVVSKGVRGQEVDMVLSDIAVTIVDKVWDFEWQGKPVDRWLFAIARRKVKEFWRIPRKDLLTNAFELDDEIFTHDGSTISLDYEDLFEQVGSTDFEALRWSPKSAMDRDERDRRIHVAIRSLKTVYAHIIDLIYWRGIDNSTEIGRILNLNPSTVRVYHKRALHELSKKLDILSDSDGSMNDWRPNS